MPFVDLHAACTEQFCRAPLHPGPCAGWKSTLKKAGGGHLLHMARPNKPGPTPAPTHPATKAKARLMHVEHMKRMAEAASRLDQMVGHGSSTKMFAHEIRSHIRKPAPGSIAQPTDWAGGDHTPLAKRLDSRFHQVMTEVEDLHDEGRPHREVLDHLAAAMAEDGMTIPHRTKDVVPADPKLFDFYAGEKPQPGVDLMVVDRPTIIGRPPGDTKDMVIHRGKAHIASASEVRRKATMSVDLHSQCSAEFCLNPLHPGPCKGWKGAITHLHVPHVPKAKKTAKPHVPTIKSPHIPKALTPKVLPTPSPLAGGKLDVANLNPGSLAHILGGLQSMDEATARAHLAGLQVTVPQLRDLARKLGAPTTASAPKSKVIDAIIAVHFHKKNVPFKGGYYSSSGKGNKFLPQPPVGEVVTEDYAAEMLGTLLQSGNEDAAGNIINAMMNKYDNPLTGDHLVQLAQMYGVDMTKLHVNAYGNYDTYYVRQAIKERLGSGALGPFKNGIAGYQGDPEVVKALVKFQMPELKKAIQGNSKFTKKAQAEAAKKAKEAQKVAAAKAKAAAIQAKIAAKTPPAVHPVGLVYKQPTPALEKKYEAWKERRKKAKTQQQAMGQATGGITSDTGYGKLFTTEEKSHLSDYSGSGYVPINAILRTQQGDPHAPFDEDAPLISGLYSEYKSGGPVAIQKNADKVRAIDDAFKKSTLHSDVQLWRGMHSPEKLFGSGWEKRDLTGAVWTEHGYSSTSAQQSTSEAFGGGVLLRLLGKKGTPAIQLHDWYSEAEYMLPRGMEYRVVAHHPPVPGGGYTDLGGGDKTYGKHVLDIELTVKPPVAEAQPSARSVLFRSIQSGISKEEPLSGGKMGATTLVETKTGGRLVRKVPNLGDGRDVERVDAEVVASIVGQAIGARVPTAVKNGFTHDASVLMEHAPGHHVTAIPTGDDAIKLGILDVLIANGDRGSGNYLVDDQGHIHGIDHGRAFDPAVAADHEPGKNPPRLKFADFARMFIENPESKDGKERKWIDNPLSKRDVEFIDEMLPQLEKQIITGQNYSDDDSAVFENHGPWFDAMMARWKQVRIHAKGERDTVAPPGWKNKIARRKEAKKKAEAALKKAAEAAPLLKDTEKKKAEAAKLAAAKNGTAVPAGDFSSLVKVSGPKGSNEGGIYEALDGTKWYVKQQKSDAHARNEALAAALYKAAGIDVPQVIQGTGAPGLSGSQTATRYLDDAKVDLHTRLSDHEYLRKVQEGFAVDAWLSNWDVAGLSYDNIVTVAGEPWRIDVGGALLFRAQGTPKGSAFGKVAGEWDTLRDPHLNPTSSQVFAGMTPEQMSASVAKVAAIKNSEIRKIVKDHGFGTDVADMIVDRKYSLKTKLAEELAKKLVGVGA